MKQTTIHPDELRGKHGARVRWETVGGLAIRTTNEYNTRATYSQAMQREYIPKK